MKTVTKPTEFLFIDANVADKQTLIAGVAKNIKVVELNNQTNALTQIAAALKGQKNLDAIHIISHGSEGELDFSSGVINSANLSTYKSQLKKIGSSLSKDGDILLYGCDIAKGGDGSAFINSLSKLTKADVAASNDTTGSASLGGDWVLENQTSDINSAALAFESYSKTLAGLPANTFLNPTNGHYYQYVATSLSWANAKIAAANSTLNGLTGYLVTITTQDESDFLFSTFSSRPDSGNSWFGAKYDSFDSNSNTKIWKWDTGPEAGQTLSYNRWQSGEPSSAGSEYAHLYNRKRTNPNDGINGDWYDEGGPANYIVEYSAAPVDTTPPVFDVAPAPSNVTTTALDLSASIDEAGKIYYVIVANDAAAPSIAQIKAGQDSTGSAALKLGNSAVSTGAFTGTFNVTGLTASTAYDVYVVAEDDESTPNVMTTATKVDVTTATPDTTPPVFDVAPAASSVTTIALDLSASIDEAGKIYYVIVANDTVAPSVAQIKAGQDSTGSAALKLGNSAVSTGAFTGTFNVTGLTASTAYDVYVVAEDDESTPNVMTTVTKVDVTTATPVAPVVTLATVKGDITLTDGTSAATNSTNGTYIESSISGAITGKSAFTLSYWVKPTTSGTSGLFSQNDQLEVNTSGTTLDVWLPNGGGSFSNAIITNEWNHIVFTGDEAAVANQLKVYNNNNLLGTITLSGSSSVFASYNNGVLDKFRGGNYASDSTNTTDSNTPPYTALNVLRNQPLNGSFDDIAFWDRVLTAEEIAKLETSPAWKVPANLQYLWDFDETTGTSTSNKAHGGSAATLNFVEGSGSITRNTLDTINFAENTVNATAQPLNIYASITDTDSANFNVGNLTVGYSQTGLSEDQLSIENQGSSAGQIGVSGTTVNYGGTEIGTISGGTNGSNLVITFNSANATPTAVQALIGALTYQNTSNAPTASRELSIVLTDDAGKLSTAVTKTITVTAENDSPAITSLDSGYKFVGNTSIEPNAGDYISLPDMQSVFNGSFTFETWINESSYGLWTRILDFGNGDPNNNILWASSSATLDGDGNVVPSGKMAFEIYGTNSSNGQLVANTTLPLNQWVHVAVTYDSSSSTATLYQDGINVGSIEITNPNDIARVNNYLAKSNWTQDDFLDARLKDFSVWGNARNAEQIAADMAGTTTDTSSLYASYPLNGDANDTLYGNDGTVTHTTGDGGFLNGSSTLLNVAGTMYDPITVKAFTISDADIGSDNATVVFEAKNSSNVLTGKLTLATNVDGGITGTNGQTISGNGTASVTVTAPLSAINTTIAANGLNFFEVNNNPETAPVATFNTPSTIFSTEQANAAPTFVDINGDEKLDAFIGKTDGSIAYYENTGTADSSTFSGTSTPTGLAALLATINVVPVLNGSFETAGVPNNHGGWDALSGSTADNWIYTSGGQYQDAGLTNRHDNWLVNTTTVPAGTVAAWIQGQASISQEINFPETGNYQINFKAIGRTYNNSNTPTYGPNGIIVKIDNVAVGTISDTNISRSAWGNYSVSVSNLSSGSHTLSLVGSSSSDLTTIVDEISIGNTNASPTFADIDGDGDLDAFVGQYDGSIAFYENTGDAGVPTFAVPTQIPAGLTALLANGTGNTNASPAFVDINGDGDLDAFVGEGDGTIVFYGNTGTAESANFTATSTPNSLTNLLVDVGTNAKPTFADIDDDGDFDAFVGNSAGNTLYFENTGTAQSSNFAIATTNSFGLTDVGTNSAPAFADINNDGTLDAFVGNSAGNVSFYENAPAAATPVDWNQNVTISINAEDDLGASGSNTVNIVLSNDALIVTKNSDDAAGASLAADQADGSGLSLREALNWVQENGIVRFGSSVHAITLGSNVDVKAGVTLDADTANTLTISGSALNFLGTMNVNNGTGDSFTIDSVLTGAGSLAKFGEGKLTLAGTNTYSGTSLVYQGTLAVAADTNLGADYVQVGGKGQGVLEITQTSDFNNVLMVAAPNGEVKVDADKTVTLTGKLDEDPNGSFNDLIKTGGGTLILANVGQFDGDGNLIEGTSNESGLSGDIYVNDGEVQVASDDALPNGEIYLADGKDLQFNDAADTNVNNTMNLNGDANVDVNNPNKTVTMSGEIKGGVGKDFTKKGDGTLDLTGTNNYAGATTVTSGTIKVNGALTNTASVGVGSGATLGGSGTIGTVGSPGDKGKVTIGDGGTLSPGNSPGLITLNKGLTLAAGAKLAIQINNATVGTGYDQVVVKGAVNVTGATLNLTSAANLPIGTVFKIIDNDGSDAVTGTFSGTSQNSLISANGNYFRVNYQGGDGNDVTLTADVLPSPPAPPPVPPEPVAPTLPPPPPPPAPFAPTIRLAVDSGSSATDTITKDGTVKVSDLVNGATWQYSIDGTNWQSGSGSSFTLTGDGTKSVSVRQTSDTGTSGNAALNFTLDSTIPTAAKATLVTDSGKASDLITNNGSIIISGIENNVVWEYSTNATTWTKGTITNFKVTREGTQSILVRQTDIAGNTSTGALNFTLDTKIQVPSISLHTDSGKVGDKITNDGTVKISGLETGANWEFSEDGKTWTTGSGDSFKLTGDGSKSISIRQTDVAGNVSTNGTLAFTLDTKIATAPTLVLVTDSGVISDKITNDGTVKVSGLETGATWEFSEDGSNWTFGSGDSFKISGEGAKSISIRQTDVAGNISANGTLSFALDTEVNTPILELVTDSGKKDSITNDGTVKISGLETAAMWEFSEDGKTWTTGSSESFKLTGDGAKSISVRQTDVAGNVSANGALSFTLDTAVNAPIIELVTDSGNKDNVTNDGTIKVSGLETGASWEFSEDGRKWIAGSSDLFKVSEDGQKTIFVRQTDVAGNVSTNSSELTFTLDTKINTPTLELTTDSANKDNVTNDGTVKVSGLETGTTWEFSEDGFNWTAGLGDSFKISGDGAKSISVRQTDVAGNISANGALSFTLDTAVNAPIIELVTDSGNKDNVTNDGTVKISGLETGASWEFSEDGKTWTTGSGDSFKLTGDGAKSISIRQTDAAGNVSANGILAFTLDTKIAATPTIALVIDSGKKDGISNDGNVKVSGLETGASWEFSEDGKTWTAGSSDSFKISGEGAKSISIRQTDVAGNVSANGMLSFTLDTAVNVPTLELVTDSGKKDSITNDGTVKITALETGASWEFSEDGKTWTTSSGDSFKLTGDGAKSISVRQTDVAGNVSVNEALSFTLDTAVNVPTLELVTDSGKKDSITNDGNVKVSGLETDASWEFSEDGKTWTMGSGDSFKISGEGEKSISVRQTDVAGNVSANGSLSFTLNTTVNNAPTLKLVTDSGKKDSITNDGTVKISGLETGASWEFSEDGKTWTTGSGDSFKLTGDGAKSISVRQTDVAGNVSANGALSFTLDTAVNAPIIELVTDSGKKDSITNDGTVKISGLETGASWEFSEDGKTWTTGSGDSFKVTGDGAKSISVRQTDVAGNSANGTLSFSLDTTVNAPIIELVTDSGTKDSITNDGTVKISGLETGASWEFSEDGKTWTTGSGESFKLTGDGAKSISVRQTDVAGNVSANGMLSFTLDTTVNTPTLELVTDSGKKDGITNDGTVKISGLETGASWKFSEDGKTWTTGSGDSFKLTGDGAKSISVRQTDVAGNVSANGTLSFSLNTTVNAPIIELVTDSGKKDSITNDGTVKIPALETGASWEFSEDGKTWTAGSGDSFKPIGDGAKTVSVRQTDVAGNVSANGTLSFTLYTAVNAPTLELVTDSGKKDSITNDGTVKISGLETGASWEFSEDGKTWTTGSGDSFKVTGDGAKSISVRQTDVAVNVSANGTLSFSLDTTVNAPIIELVTDSGTKDSITNDGTVKISGLETGASWEFSEDGKTWTTGSGESFKLTGDGAKSISVRQTDVAGNVSANGTLSFTLDTKIANTAPVFTSATTFELPEKTTAITTITATDKDGDLLNYSLAGGANQDLFTLNSTTGKLSFKAPVLFDAKTAAANNYAVSVSVSDGKISSMQNLTINVLADLDGDGKPDKTDPDIDNDGLLNSIEDSVLSAFGGGTGDGNGDGLIDSSQLNIASIPTLGSASIPVEKRYATFEVAGGYKITNVQNSTAPASIASKALLGQFSFNIENVAVGGSVDMSLYVDSSLALNSFYKTYYPNPNDYKVNKLGAVPTTLSTVGSKTKITFTLTDGGKYDADHTKNGVIVDPGAPVIDDIIKPVTLNAEVKNLIETDSILDASGKFTGTNLDKTKIVAQTTKIGIYGTFNINDVGDWTYTTNSPHNEFLKDQIYTDIFTVKTTDGVASNVTINMTGTRDLPLVVNDFAKQTIETIASQKILHGQLTLQTAQSIDIVQNADKTWTDLDMLKVDFALNNSVNAGVNFVKTTLANGSVLTLNTVDGSYIYTPNLSKTITDTTDNFTVTADDVTLVLKFNRADLLDRDGISDTVESSLADLANTGDSNAKAGDLNGDGLEDKNQGAVTNIAWMTNKDFNAALNNTLTDVKPIINIVVASDNSGKVDGASQLSNVSVLPSNTGGGKPKSTSTSGKLETPWDPLQFSVSATSDKGLTDTDLSRDGVQQLIKIDISRSGATDFNGYMKYVSAATINAYQKSGTPLITLDNEVLTIAKQAGWYDYTQRVLGGDGATFIRGTDGKITDISIIITDNKFGDDDIASNQITDPSLPVIREIPVEPIKTIEKTFESGENVSVLATEYTNLKLLETFIDKTVMTTELVDNPLACLPEWTLQLLNIPLKISQEVTKIEKIVAPLSGTGNSLANTITGNSAANVLTGLDGADTFVFGDKDVISDFNVAEGDKIDLRGVKFVRFDSATQTLHADTNSDGIADASIQLLGVSSLPSEAIITK